MIPTVPLAAKRLSRALRSPACRLPADARKHGLVALDRLQAAVLIRARRQPATPQQEPLRRPGGRPKGSVDGTMARQALAFVDEALAAGVKTVVGSDIRQAIGGPSRQLFDQSVMHSPVFRAGLTTRRLTVARVGQENRISRPDTACRCDVWEP